MTKQCEEVVEAIDYCDKGVFGADEIKSGYTCHG